MDKLRHIDELLKESLGQNVESGEFTSDWLAIEKRLKQRKNRIYAMWFSLALIALTSVSVLLYTNSNPASNNNLADTPNRKITDQTPSELNSNTNTQDDRSVIENEEGITSEHFDDVEDIISSNQESKPSDDATIQQGINADQISNTIPDEVISEEDQPGWIDPSVEMTPTNEVVFIESELPDIAFAPVQTNELDNVGVAKIGTDKKSGVKLGHIEMGVSFTPSVSGKFTSERSDLAWLVNRTYKSKVASNESATFANNTSVNAEFHFTNGWFIGSGFGVAERTEFLSYDYIIDHAVAEDYQKQELTYFKLLPSDWQYVSHQGSNSYHFIEIPLTIGYKTSITRNMELRNQVDFSYMLLYNQLGKKADYTTLELNDLADLNYLNSSNAAATIKSGVYYKFKNFVIGGEPTFSMNLNSLSNKSSAIKVTPYNYGFNITTNIKINQK